MENTPTVCVDDLLSVLGFFKNDPSARPQTEFLCKPIPRIMEEKSIKRNHGGGVVGGAMIEKRSLRRNH